VAARSYRYRIFNQALQSPIAIPELPLTEDLPPGLTFEIVGRDLDQPEVGRHVHQWYDARGQVCIACQETSKGSLLRFSAGTSFLFDQHRALITAYHDASVPTATLRHLLIDQVIPRVLAAQGKVVLHASAVRVAGGCIGFLGASGAGKSTLAASFLSTGLDLICDDALLLLPQEESVIAVPSYAGCRLCPASAAQLRNHLRPLAAINPLMRKQRFAPCGPMHRAEPYELIGLFSLSSPSGQHADGVPEVRKSSGSDAFTDLIRHTLVANPREPRHQTAQLSALAQLVNSRIGFFSLSYPQRFTALPLVQAAVLDAIGIGG
jgi:hypothetical protein